MRFAAILLTLGLFAACAKQPMDRKALAMEKVRIAQSAIPGMSVEKAVEQVLKDMAGKGAAASGRWYSNPAIEYNDEAYKVGYEFTQNGKTARFGWVWYADSERLEPITDYARQVTP